MTDKDTFITLVRLRDMLYFGVRPTLRQCGFAPEIVQDLVNRGLIRVGDKQFGDEPDRYEIEAILPAGVAFISHQDAFSGRKY